MKIGRLNIGPDHLRGIEIGKELTNIEEGLSNAQLFIIGMVDDYYDQIVHFLATRMAPEGFTTNQKK